MGVVAAVVMKKDKPADEAKQFFERVADNAFCIDSRQVVDFIIKVENGEIQKSIHGTKHK